MAVETIEGNWHDVLHYHYDVPNDVLYLRLNSRRQDEVYGEEDENGFHVMRSLRDDAVVGMTVVGYWRQFGPGGAALAQPDWQQGIERDVAGMGQRLHLVAA